mgnify:CR=1 FL=1
MIILSAMSLTRICLPAGVTPTLGPDATGVGWGYQYAVMAQKRNLAELRASGRFASVEVSDVRAAVTSGVDFELAVKVAVSSAPGARLDSGPPVTVACGSVTVTPVSVTLAVDLETLPPIKARPSHRLVFSRFQSIARSAVSLASHSRGNALTSALPTLPSA